MQRSLIVASMLAAGCATAPTPREFDRMALIEGAPFDATWDRVIDVFGERVWPIDNVERASGLITTDWMIVSEGPELYMDCGRAGMLRTHRDHEVRLNVLVREAERGAEVTVNAAMRATAWDDVDGHPIEIVNCVSTGVLEREIHEDINARVVS